MLRIETLGSYLYIQGNTYRRTPKKEGHRPVPAHGTTPGPLQDLVVHELTDLIWKPKGTDFSTQKFARVIVKSPEGNTSYPVRSDCEADVTAAIAAWKR